MKATQKLHALGQSLWLDNITRDLLTSGTLRRYIDELSVTGLTSNPTIFDHAVARSHSYDDDIRRLVAEGKSDEALFFELAVADLTKAADLFAPIHQRTAGVDGFVSLEVSPLLAHDTARTVAEARALHGKANRANLFIKIPGTIEGLPAIEEAIYSGVPINVTLLFSRDDYLRAADAYMRGLERRVVAGLSPDVRSVASLFVSRWDKATMEKLPGDLRDRLGIAISQQAYKAYCDLLDFGPVAAPGRARCTAATPVVREHQQQGSAGLRCALHGCACRTEHRQHGTGRNADRVRKSWRGGSADAPGWRRLRTGPGEHCPRRHRCRCTCRAVAGRGGQGFRRVPGRICSGPSKRRAKP